VSGRRARMFVALDLPEEVRTPIAGWRDGLMADRDELRPVPAAALHVTLAFLGWQDEAAAERIAAMAFEAADGIGAPLLTPVGVRAVPPRRPRLFALDLADEGGRAGSLQGAVTEALGAAHVFEPERRPFWAHVTLARVKRGARSEQLPAEPEPPGQPFTAPELTLYRSTLRPQGAVYDPLARTELAAYG
jgi:2'-5' RNA ligase